MNAALKRPPRFGDGRDWFFEKRFGMFVHWGLYAIPAWHEQHQWRRRVPRAEYVKLAGEWYPTRFDPNAWLDIMEAAGMEYICLTTKHHDGFCLWDTKATRFNTMNTPYGRDVVGMLAEACHKRNVPLCLYYSVADWNHPAYPNEGRHHELPGPEPGDAPDWARYMDFVRAQVRELCTDYGEVHGFWWDMNVPKHVDRSVNDMIRELQPMAVINNRGFDEGDFGTPERDFDPASAEAAGFDRPTEACQSIGMESWGFREGEDYYTDRHLIASIDRYLARDANYLLNVGPTGTGEIAAEARAILERVGAWHSAVRESSEGVEPVGGLAAAPGVLLTRRDRTLYVHVNAPPAGDRVLLKPIKAMPASAVLLNDGREVDAAVELLPRDHGEQKAYLRLRRLPADEMAGTVMVVRLEFDTAFFTTEITEYTENG
ncbi:MAG: alpha-L-fucosidase [Planctomycetota bacterium]|jgi:alpha-L-fucosidase